MKPQLNGKQHLNGTVRHTNGHAAAALHGFTMSFGEEQHSSDQVVDAALDWICAELLENRPPQMGFALDSRAEGGCIRVGGISTDRYTANGGRQATSKRLRELAKQEGAQALVVWAWKRLKGEEKRARLVLEVSQGTQVTTLMVPADQLAKGGGLNKRALRRYEVAAERLASPVIMGNVLATAH